MRRRRARRKVFSASSALDRLGVLDVLDVPLPLFQRQLDVAPARLIIS
jgi:hypothetical protein